MFSFRYKGLAFPALERINRQKVIPCASQSSISFEHHRHLHIPVSLPSEKKHLVPTRYETERGQKYWHGCGGKGRCSFSSLRIHLYFLSVPFLFFLGGGGCLCFFDYEIPCLFSYVSSWLPPLSSFCLGSITCTSTCSHSRFYSESCHVYQIVLSRLILGTG